MHNRGVKMMNISFSENLKKVVNELDDSLKTYDAEKIEKLSVPLNIIRDEVRELIQENLRECAERVVKKLRRDENLSTQEIQLIAKWVVGDADYYSRIENNLMDWLVECKRLCKVIRSHATEGVEKDEEKLFVIGALLTDLKYTLTDVIRYAEAMNRVDRFKETLGTGYINRETKQWLAELIEQQIASDEF